MALFSCFCTADSSYLYDFGLNEFFRIDDRTRELLQNSPDGPRLVAAQHPTLGILAVDAASSITIPDQPEFEAALSHRLGALILCLTERCNMRCDYCTYSGQFALNRQHSSARLSWDLARQALDYYLPRAESPTLGFFGGEPLLELDLACRCIDYAADRVGASPTVNITVNGTLLTPRAVRRLAERNANVVVSLDGAQFNHDRHRRLLSGRPTFDIIMRRLRDAADMCPEWFTRSLRVHMVATPPYDLTVFEQLVDANRTLLGRPARATLGFVTTDDVISPADDATTSHTRDAEVTRLRHQYALAHIRGTRDELTVEPSLFDSDIFRIHRRPVFTEPNAALQPNGTCIPGLRRLFLTVDGSYHLCERINPTLSVGSVASGIDPQRSYDLLRAYAAECAHSCRSCWAARFCSLCFVHAAGDARLEGTRLRRRCPAIRDRIASMFVTYNAVMEQNAAAFDYMDEYYML